MPPAARVLDTTDHPGLVAGPGVPNVLIGGLPAAAATDLHACFMPTPSGAPAHPPTPFPVGSVTVLIAGRPALRMGDAAGCGAHIVTGMPTVIVG